MNIDRPNRRAGWNLDTAFVRRRYDRVAALIPFFEWLLFLPGDFRAKAAARLDLKRGARVLEIGCGTGRNLPFLRAAVGDKGHVYGIDLSDGMLQRARALSKRRGWSNVTLTQADATTYEATEPLDGVLFGLSYNTLIERHAVLRRAWAQLRPGGALVIMDAKVPAGRFDRIVLPFSDWLMKRTLLGNPHVRPWEELAKIAPDLEMDEFLFGSYDLCRATKPLA
jgi:ubiquinone/menaquinone biosynthesis C-methylase UbiE